MRYKTSMDTWAEDQGETYLGLVSQKDVLVEIVL